METKTAEEFLEESAGHPLDAIRQYADQQCKAEREKVLLEAIDKMEKLHDKYHMPLQAIRSELESLKHR